MDEARTFVRGLPRSVFTAVSGIQKEVFIRLYSKYCGYNTIIRKPIQLFEVFIFLKLYPTQLAQPIVFNNIVYYRRQYHRLIKRRVLFLAAVINEVDQTWNRRFEEPNALPHVFDRTVTGCLDSFPIHVNRPVTSNWQKLMYNGKYKGHVMKVQAICDHHGSIVWYSGPHIGSIHDIKLWNLYGPRLSLGEKLLADKGYISSRNPELIVPYKNPSNLTDDEKSFNRVLQWYRTTIEHSFAYIKRFTILSGCYRGKITVRDCHIQAALKIIVHSNNMHTTKFPLRTHYRYVQ